MKLFKKLSGLGLLAVLSALVISCGQSSSTTNSLPRAQDPEQKPQQKLEVPPSNGTDSRLPDLSKAVSIDLSDKTDYTALKDLAADFTLPLVGDPKISMNYTSSLSKGNVLLAFEDKLGFWGASIPSFEGTGLKTANSFDMIFSDNELVVRVKGTLNGDAFIDPSTVYFRERKTGETACLKSVTTCDIINPGFNWGNFVCPYPQPDNLTPCLQYMNTANPDVKVLGKFKSTFSQWATLSEGN